ncbi:heparinase II/III-family protein [Dyadobacter sp. CY345]|uniref:heparinase II/III-family protein n=1 Tax=Dyadobacter sp. CY345 TaxID=2909335 RepID=UPI001F30D88D|nr:heparinase II/III-family protein [Dyadobacter sp. CY345]MCF2443252.1 heparinase II/III-family protein [Dyadobacter sp. CY345]
MNISRFGFSLVLIHLVLYAQAQIKLPTNFSTVHPRIHDKLTEKSLLKYKADVDPYVEKSQTDSTWMLSRLQMYWKTKSTDVFIKSGVYDHAEGTAPVATVKFPGARDNTTIYGSSKLEDIQPYEDDPRGIQMINRSKAGQPLEWADIAKTGRNIEAINTNIIRLAAEAGSLYVVTKKDSYAKFAFNLFDTYMTGMYYRKEPYDLSHGHHQTITGLSTYEVIQEVAMLSNLTSLYDNLFNYIQKKAPDKNKIYVDTFKKWADIQLKNGVAFNNWNLMQAKNVLMIAHILQPDSSYADKKGTQYYLNQVLNEDSERQWSIVKVMNEGYDPKTGIWNESAGYSSGVLHDFTGYINWFDQNFNYDLLSQMPVLEKAVLAETQYIFPNGFTTGFGDSHYHQLEPKSAWQLVENARKNGKTAQEEKYTKFIKTIDAFNRKSEPGYQDQTDGLISSVPAGKIEDYVSTVFSAPNVSYFAQRNGMDPKNGLMVAMAGSKGNHMHANGISMEIYGKGLILGPDGGIGTSYFQQDYAEYYSQFPAHNTVAVDGISAYPVMKSNHGFDVLSSYPQSDQKTGYFPKVTFGSLYFLEPETQSDQNRLTSIIRTGDTTGYYVDIFRSKRKDNQDKMHDYFYHNLGGELTLTNEAGKPLDLKPTEKLSFAGGHLFAYDYFFDKKSIVTNQDFNATFKVNLPGKNAVFMNLWMKGSADREVFAVKAPISKEFRNNLMIPDTIAELPLSTIVARQNGQAWTRPFVAVYEPSSTQLGRSVERIASFTPPGSSSDFVGLEVKSKSGIKDYIFSSSKTEPVSHDGMKAAASYAVVSMSAEKKLNYLFIGKGLTTSYGQFAISLDSAASAVLQLDDDTLYYGADAAAVLALPDYGKEKRQFTLSFEQNGKMFAVKGKRVKGMQTVSYALPAIPYQKIVISN